MRVMPVVLAALICGPGDLLASAASAACHQCDPYLHCVQGSPGAMVCLEGPGACAMAVPCLGGPVRYPDAPEELTTISLFEAAAPAGVSLRSEAGSLAVGEDARAMCAQRAAIAGLVDAGIAYGEEFAVSFVTAAGDGFALRRALAGDQVRLEVLEVAGARAGRVLASGLLGERDQLTLPVRIEGRDRMLVLQAGRTRGQVPGEIARLRRSLAASAGRIPPRAERLFELRPE